MKEFCALRPKAYAYLMVMAVKRKKPKEQKLYNKTGAHV